MQGSLCSGNAPLKTGGNQGSAQAIEHVVFRLYSLQEDLLAPALLLVFSITLLTCKQEYHQQISFPK